MSSPKDFDCSISDWNVKFPLLCGVNTSFALSLLAWSSDASTFSNLFNVRDDRFSPRIMHSRKMYLVRLLSRTDVVATGLSKKFGDIRSLLQTVLLVRQEAFRTAFRKVFSHQKVHPEFFADSSPWNPPSIRYPDRTAIAPQMSHSFTLRTALSAIPSVSDLCGVDVQWFQGNSSQDLPNSKELSV